MDLIVDSLNLCFFYFSPYSRLVKSESSDSLLSQMSGNTNHHHHAVTSKKPQLERELSMTCQSVPVHRYKTSRVTTKASSGQKSVHESKALRQTKESRSQKHTRVTFYFLSLLILYSKKFL